MTTTAPATPAPQPPHDPNPPTNPPTMTPTTPTTPDEKAAYTALLDTAIAASRAFGAMLDSYISVRDAGGTAAALAACNEALEAPYQAFLRAMGDLGIPVGAVGDDGSEDGSEIDWGFGERGGAGGSEPGVDGGGMVVASGDGVSEVAEESGGVERL